MRRTLALPLLITATLTTTACEKVEPITTAWSDDFERSELGSDWHNTGGPYRIDGGKLKIKGAYNKPLWLKRPIPRDAEISFDVRSDSPSGDIKVEVWGDGKTFATHRGSYLASSYVFIFGGWGNSISALCRLDEHGKDRKEKRGVKVQKGKTYRWVIRRKGSKVSWSIDGEPFLELDDTAPLEGKNHAHFGFNNWASDLTFDNLKIRPL
ncbi:MAG: hypothetical protein CSA65_00295 [Proteobacteria bacterium]|nr:MAG: hypothetical protein CSB49_06840 [Pseudomonadota bacterium]PIE19921.1 MAG: hypothetical protein CSA65_00295 [Pseudomonadota bacterium]